MSSCNECSSAECSALAQRNDETDEQFIDRQEITRRMCKIKHKIAVISGKGGVGKSTVAVNLAVSLTVAGKKVGLMDVDVHGPSIPTMLKLRDTVVRSDENGIYPLEMGNLKVMSVGYLLKDQDDPVIFRGPRKMGLIKQFVKDVEWGELDYLIIDTPPGTGDEALTTIQLIESMTGAVVVTTPQEVAGADVRKSINFCHALNLNIIGLIENMASFLCPGCGTAHTIFGKGGGEEIAEKFNVPLLGSIPIDPRITISGDEGKPFIYHYAKTETAQAMAVTIESIESLLKENNPMRFAIPTAGGKLCMHFGHCEEFTIIDVEGGKIVSEKTATPPPHEPGVLPKWVGEEIKADVILAGGMGQRAQELFSGYGVKIVTGVTPSVPRDLVLSYIDGTLATGANACDH